MASFHTALQELKTILTDGLQTYCGTNFSKLPTVSISYKRRAEVTIDTLPVVFITRPSVDNKDDQVGCTQSDQTVLMYVGFCEHDREVAAEKVIKFEEEIETVIRSDRSLNGSVLDIEIINSVNDEGNFHPVYFFVVELRAKFRTY